MIENENKRNREECGFEDLKHLQQHKTTIKKHTKLKRYDSWYMPIKLWSKIKDNNNRSNTLVTLKNDPQYLFKNLYKNINGCPPGSQSITQE